MALKYKMKKHYDLFERITLVKNEKKEDFRIIFFLAFLKKKVFMTLQCTDFLYEWIFKEMILLFGDDMIKTK